MALLQTTLAGLPHGLDTVIGSGGYRLSGGQKQRLSLARARLRDPPVLILDEATSGLDPASKVLIMDAIRHWRKGKTTIIITHDLSQIKDEEYVHVMESGCLAQKGRKKDLEALDGLLKSLLESANHRTQESTDSPSSEDDTHETGSLEDGGVDSFRMSRLFHLVHGHGQTRGILNRMSLGQGVSRTIRPKLVWDLPAYADSERPPPSFRRASQSVAWAQHGILPETRSQTLEISPPSRRTNLEMIQKRGQAVKDNRSSAARKHPKETRELNHRAALGSLEGFFLERMAENKCRSKKPGTRPTPSVLAILRTVWPTLDYQHRLQLVSGLFMCVISAGCNPAFSFIFAQLLATLSAPANKLATGRKWASCLAIVAVIDASSTFLTYFLLKSAAAAWVDNLRNEAFRRILSQPKTWFDSPGHSSSHITQCLDRNAEEMRKLLGLFVPVLLAVSAMISISLVWALTIRWDLTLIALSGLLVAIGTAQAHAVVNDKWETRYNAATSEVSALFAEIFTNIRVVCALTLESYFSRKHSTSVDSTYRLGLRRATRSGFFFGLYQSMVYFITALIFYYATRLLRDTNISVGEVLRVVNLLIFSIGTAAAMLSNIPQIAAVKVTAMQMLYYANLPWNTEPKHRSTTNVLTPFPVEMKRLAFSYPTRDQRVLRNVSLTIQAGEFVAIVGASGCGKSTIAALLLMLYEPSSCQSRRMSMHQQFSSVQQNPHLITTHQGGLKGHSISDNNRLLQLYLLEECFQPSTPPLSFARQPATHVSTEKLRSLMAYVPQQPFLFPTTLAENILYGLNESSPLRAPANLYHAAQLAGIHVLIMSLPHGYETVVGGGRLCLSGGQMQRVNLARALARRPQFLLLDEPTSALDAVAAQTVRIALRGLVDSDTQRQSSMSVAVMTHSRKMMRIADRIVLLNQGIVAESGSYDELLGKQRLFAQLVGGDQRLAVDGGDQSSRTI